PLSTLFVGVEVFAWTAFIVQIPLSFAALRLDYELRWYMLSDRALRIREGVLSVRERTMTFANIQQIAVRQGPLQRVLGLADLEVRTAGGGGSDGEGDGTGDLHRGYLRGVERVEWVRDTLRARVHRYRDSGLGDPGEIPPPHRPEAAGRPSLHGGAVAAATELLNEVRALRVETERRAATAGSVADPSGRRGDPEDPP
ncbi:MAG: PH domain-containing protein, partial [Gemmatimonadota bacterium]